MSIRGGQTRFRSFEAARAFALALQFTSSEAWSEFCASGQRPSDIPLLVTRNTSQGLRCVHRPLHGRRNDSNGFSRSWMRLTRLWRILYRG